MSNFINVLNPPAVIYHIKCKTETVLDSYIGVTLGFKSRMNKHRYDSIHSDRKLYKSIKNNGGWDNWDKSVLAVVPNWTNKKQYREIEKSFICLYKPNCNKNIPNRTCKEYQKANPEKMKQYNLKYAKNNKDKIRIVGRLWQQKNKVKVNESSIKWYRKHKQEINNKMNYKTGCLCGCKVNYSHLKYGIHKTSKVHHKMSLLNIQNSKLNLKHNDLNINII